MKNTSYIGISLVILIFGIIFIPRIIDKVSNNDIVEQDRLNINKKKKVNNETLAYIELYGEKKKVPNFTYINQEGDSISNKDYLGKVYIVEFFFTTCPSICPIMNRNLLEVDKEVDHKDFGIASFTIDPKHDTPQVLKQYADNYGITNPNWNFLTGEQEKIYDLANGGFGIYANQDVDSPGGFAHQGMFALVDKEGYIRSRTDDFGNPIIYYRGAIERDASIVEGQESPQIDELIEDINQLLQ